MTTQLGSVQQKISCVFETAVLEEQSSKPWLWARLDRKPNKIADRKFKKFQTVHKQWIKDGKEGTEPTFTWDVLKDFK
ncbi:hypothetical protein KUTeg_022703, partial [Tegillarca granosa]